MIQTIIQKMMSKKCCQNSNNGEEKKTIMVQANRRKLWDMEHNYHCAVIGTCLTITEVRNLLKHFHIKVADYSDYEVHTIAVTIIEDNDSRTKKINKHLDRKFKTSIQKIKRMDYSALRHEWHNVLKNGDMIGMFWAIISHPLADEKMQRDIYGDIHMLSHLSGASNRADLKHLKSLQSEQSNLRNEINHWKNLSHKRYTEIEALKYETDDQLKIITFFEQKFKSLNAVNEQLSHLNNEKNYQQMVQQIDKLKNKILKQDNKIHILENKNYHLISQITNMETQQRKDTHSIARYQQETKQLQIDLIKEQQDECESCELKDESLCGQCILYVGGQASMTPHYKEIIEGKSAVFLHHDGGIEKNTQELKSMLNRADVVICPTNCISHKAYWQIKKSCKKQNKPCKFIHSSGVSSLTHLLENISNEMIGKTVSQPD